MVGDVDVIHPWKDGATREMNPAGVLGVLTDGARKPDHQISEELAERMLRIARDRGRQEIIAHAVDQGDVAPRVGKHRVGTTPAPFVPDRPPTAKLLHASASSVEQRGRNLSARGSNTLQHVSEQVDRLFERRTEVG